MADSPDPQVQTKLPDNAYRELKPGEVYTPMVPPGVTVPEITRRSIVFGICMNAVFAMAATYLALKVGQGIETAIPISILAVGLSGFLLRLGHRRSTLLENINVLAIGTTSGIVAGGTTFTMPAIYILKLDEKLEIGGVSLFLLIFLVPFLGAILGALFLVPFRRYFVKDMHGKLPFPEATATNEILVSGQAGGKQAFIWIYSFVIGAVYNWLSGAMKLFNEWFTTGEVELPGGVGKTLAVDSSFFHTVTHKVKAVFSLGTGAELCGLGYIIGLRYASIICAGSFLSWFVIIPLLAPLDLEVLRQLNPAITADGPAELVVELDGRLEQHVDRHLASDSLREAFGAEVGTLTSGAVVMCSRLGDDVVGPEWTVLDGDARYVVRLEDNQLNIYDVAVAEDGAAQARGSISVALQSELDSHAVSDELRQRFADGGIALTAEAVASTQALGATWQIKDDDRTYRIEKEQGALHLYSYHPTAENIFRAVPRNIGIGGIFTAGLLSILKMSRIIFTALTQALGGLFKSKKGGSLYDRTDEDITYPRLVLVGVLATIAIAIYFRGFVLNEMSDATGLTVISVVLALGITFLFTTVSAWAIAMISVTPISGMTVTTIIITAVLLLAAGLPTETEHQRNLSMLAVLLVGGVVCSGLSMAGTLVTEFKLGFWLGASPKRIQWSAICASLLASVLVTATIMVLAQEPSFDPSETGYLKAPQANVMASALKSFIGGGEVPWVMYGTGVAVVLLVELIGISGLAFALGMYLPMELNTPILVGAIVAALVRKSSGDSLVSMARRNKGILIASGLIAGGAIIGVLKSVFTLVSEKTMEKMDMATRMVASGRDAAEVARLTNWLGVAMFLALCAFVYLDCRRAKPEDAGPEIHM